MRKFFALFLVLFGLSLASHAFSTKAQQAILLDAVTGTVLYEKNANIKMPPSSMSKLMTLYIVFQRLKSGEIKLSDKFLVSERAWRAQGSRMFISPHTYVSVEDLLRGVIVQSGNDASIVLAEGIAGTEHDFAELMNYTASELGLKYSHFMNATGLPNKDHYMSAADIAALSLKLMRDFPEYYHYFSEKEFAFNKIRQPNRNILLNSTFGVDGLKTGHTDIGRYGIALSAFKNGRRIVLVVNGLKTEQERASEAASLLQYGLLNFVNITVSTEGKEVVAVPVALGKNKRVKLGTTQTVVFTIPRAFEGRNEVTIRYPSTLYAPVYREKRVGEMVVRLYNGSVHRFDLHPLSDARKASAVRRFFVKASAFIKHFRPLKRNSAELVRVFKL